MLTKSTSSIWGTGVRRPAYGPLRLNTRADVCVVGAGISGLTTAYLLTRAGKSVVVLDDGPIGGGMTEMTTAHLSNAVDDRYFEIERLHGAEGAKQVAESHTRAIDQIEEIVAMEAIECDFERVDGFLFNPPGADTENLDREFDAAHRAGLRIQRVARAPLPDFDTGPGLRFPRQAQFHPLRYLAALARAVVRAGGTIHSGSHAEEIEGGERARVRVGKHEVTAGAIVVATNAPVNDRFVLHTKQAPYLTYVIAAPVPRKSVPHALLWDTDDPYHYVRVHPLRRRADDRPTDLLIVGGEDHKTGQAEDTGERHARLEAWARERFPTLGRVEFRWAGQVMETQDGLAFLGRNPLDANNVYVATGDSGMGMTHGTIGGMLITDLILGRTNPWTTLYDPDRKTLRAAGTFVRENLNVAAQYSDWITPGSVASVEEIPRDGGGVVRRGMHKIAVYRDGRGALHELSAVCPHLGCIVGWNPTEQSWDCPCHGSRYDKLGKLINGPSNADLGPPAT